MSQEAYRVYRRDIAENPDVLEYFEQATPVNELDTARIGSRPARRSKGRGSKIFAPSPGSLAGCKAASPSPPGSASDSLWSSSPKRVPRTSQLLREIANGFPMFSGMLEQRGTRHGQGRSRHRSRLFRSGQECRPCESESSPCCEEEFLRSRRMILRVTGQRDLLARNRVLARSIRLRNPYVDPMSLIQVELLRRKQHGQHSSDLEYPMGATINGIAAGLHNTG